MKKTEKKLTPKRVGKWAMYMLVVTAVFTAITVATRGWPLFFAHPEAEDIQCVTITQSATGETALVDASSEDLELTANLLGCLSYKPFSQGEGEPAYVLEYSLKDGRLLTVGVNETSVFYQGKSHLLKMEDFPFNAVEGVLLR